MDYLNYNLKEGYKKIYNYYELNNHLMTLGLDIYWRIKASNIVVSNLKDYLLNTENQKFIYCDLCVGTGEFLQEMLHKIRKMISNQKFNQSLFIGIDFSFDMLQLAKQKKVYQLENVIFILADVSNLPIKNNSLDLVSISLGIRNLRNSNDKKDENIFINRFKEIRDKIKIKGYFIGLETSRPPNKIIRKLSDLFTLYISTSIAKIVSKDFHTYTYLAKSIVDFFDPEEFKSFLLSIGFTRVNYYLFTFGVVALHIAQK